MAARAFARADTIMIVSSPVRNSTINLLSLHPLVGDRLGSIYEPSQSNKAWGLAGNDTALVLVLDGHHQLILGSAVCQLYASFMQSIRHT